MLAKGGYIEQDRVRRVLPGTRASRAQRSVDIGASQGCGHAEPVAVVRVVDPDAVSYEFDNYGASFSVPMMLSRAQVFVKQDRDTSVEQS